MKKTCVLLCVMVLAIGVIMPAGAEIGSLMFSSMPQGMESPEETLTEREYDPDGSAYPFTGNGENGRQHTVMLYLCGADLEPKGGPATMDLQEIIQSAYDQDQISLLVMAGGTKKWFNHAVDADDTAIYEVVGDSLVKRASNGLMSMGQPKTLTQFVNYCYSNFPAKNYSLILWDHGGGPLGGLIHDQISNDVFRSVLDVRDALENTPAAKEKLYLLGFDACLEGSVEIANVFAPYAHQMVASEESEPGLGWNYLFMKDLLQDGSPADTGKNIVNLYFEQYGPNVADKLTLSTINLDRMDELLRKSEVFFGQVQGQLNKDTFLEFASKRQHFESVDKNPRDLIDLAEMVEAYKTYAPDQAEDLLITIQETVDYEKHNKGFSSGLSVYFPYYDYRNYPRSFAKNYQNLNYDGGYTAFIDQFNTMQHNVPRINWNIGSKGDVRDTRTIFSLQLTPEQAANLAEYSLVILRKLGQDNTFVVVKPDGQAELIDSQLVGDYVHGALYIVDANGERSNALPLVWTRDAYGHYIIPAALLGENGSMEIQLVCDLNDETGEMTVATIYTLEENGIYYTNRAAVDLDAYETIRFTVPVYEATRDEDGALVGVFDWKPAAQEEYTMDLHGDWTLSMLLDTIDPSELYAAFVLTDYYRMTHTSELISVVPQAPVEPVLVLTYDDDYVTLELNVENSVSTNNGDVYIRFTVTNPNQQEVFIHLDQLILNGAPVDAELWIEGDGGNGGILPGEQGVDTLVLSGLLTDQPAGAHTIALTISVVDAADHSVISSHQASGYLYLPE